MRFTHSSECVLAPAAWSPWGNWPGALLLLLLLSGWGPTVASAETSPTSEDELSVCGASVLCSSVPSGGSAVISSSWTAGGTHRLSSLFCSSFSCRSLSWSDTFSNSLNVWRGNNRLSQIKAWTSLNHICNQRGGRLAWRLVDSWLTVALDLNVGTTWICVDT